MAVTPPSTRLKAGVKVAGLKPETLLAIIVAHDVVTAGGYEFCITSIAEGHHMQRSKHYTGHAFDWRTRDMPPEVAHLLNADIQRRLGPDYDCIIEKDHGHLEFDPKS